MNEFKCKACGGTLIVSKDSTIAYCEYCGAPETVPLLNTRNKAVMFERAQRLLEECEFDAAATIFENIIADDREEAEAYWGLVLCKYGIQYVYDERTNKRIPTCRRTSFKSVLEDDDYKSVERYSDENARKIYREKARRIEALRKSIIEVSNKEKPYDIFICYKETALNKRRTEDSVLAESVYNALTDKGYRVFFSRITLEDKLGQDYESYIFAALNSAKIMLAFGTCPEHFNAVWVKNEWSRFQQLIEKSSGKYLIPCYKDMDPYEMPRAFSTLQAQDMGKLGAIQDLTRGIEKLIGSPRHKTRKEPAPVVEKPKSNFFKEHEGLVKGFSITCISLLCICLLTFMVCFSWIDSVESAISNIPDTNINYARSGQDIIDAYNAYEKLPARLKKYIKGYDSLMDKIEGYDAYALNLVRETLAAVNAESVQNTDILSQILTIDQTLLDSQRDQLSPAEFTEWENMICVANTIDKIDALINNIVGKYETLSEIRSDYNSLPSGCKALVYNYSKLDGIDAKYALMKGLVFEGGTISVNPEYAESLSGALVIPETYNGMAVTNIPAKGFANCSNVTSIVVPDSVTSIGEAAFSGCTRLQSLTIPFVGENRTTTGKQAVLGYMFGEDSYIGGTRIEQQYSDGYWDYGCFYIPNQLRTVVVTDANQIGYGAFYNCSKLNSIQVDYSVEVVSDYAFCNCSGIGEMILPNITKISNGMLKGCSSITAFKINDKVTEIGSYAFWNCAALSTINSDTAGSFIISNSIINIGEGAFGGCLKLQSLTIPFVGENRTATGKQAVLGYMFGEDSYTSGTRIEQQYSDEYWDYGCFYIPNQLRTVLVTDVNQIGYGAFYNCEMLTKIELNNKIMNIGACAFYKCSNITLLNISSQITEINDYTFWGCSSLTRLNSETDGQFIVSDSVQIIGYAAFGGCMQLKTLTIPFVGKSRVSIGENALLGYMFGKDTYTGGAQIEQQYSDGYWDYGCFYIPNQLRTVQVTDANQIGYGAFYNCSMLTSIKINTEAKSSIGSKAFEKCVSPKYY